MRRGRGLTAEEAALWRRVKASVTPLRPQKEEPALDPAALELIEPAARAKTNAKAKATAAPIPPASAKTQTSAPSQPADRAPERRVRRGQVEVVAALDLHGFTQDQARQAVYAFLRAQQRPQACVVLVVTGKGGRLISGEATAGVLKQRFPGWLADAAVRPLVAGFAAAHARHGGGGAFYVFLKRRGE